ncbi:tail sheath [Vibrio phage 11895-B1]|uniref:tail sheath n=1 Tax=Vibrio phage 11895-B1 TaxID=754075 RepID=UPI0002C04AC1|nr:tail sheath [Vibrio phage 11895-B1]AGH32175.1 hypothetical protein VPHG_00108 [Vibrio phage 11895-B1]
MTYKAPVAVNIRQATTSASVTDLNRSIFIAPHSYGTARQKSFSSLSELNADTTIPKDSPAYIAISRALAGAGSRSLPIYLGRIEVTDIILTPTLANSATYSFTVQVVDTTTYTDSVAAVEISFTSDTDATLTEITAGLDAALTTAGITSSDIIVTDNGTDITLLAAANRLIVTSELTENLVQTFDFTETAATAFANIIAEDNDSWYYVTTAVRDIDWILDLADVIEATESSDNPKIFRVSSNAPATIVAQTDPSAATDLLGLLDDADYKNTFGEWHDQADEIYPELTSTVYYGSFFVGTQNWAFMNNCPNPIARHPVLGRQLTTGEIGFIYDRNAAVRYNYMSVAIYGVGENGDAPSQSAWMDNLSIAHWIRLTMKQRVFNTLVNAANGGLPLTFTAGDRAVIQERCESVLNEGVDRKMLLGHTGVTVPDNISFSDQAARTLQDVTFTGYYAGKINFVIIDGILTYTEETA